MINIDMILNKIGEEIPKLKCRLNSANNGPKNTTEVSSKKNKKRRR